LLKAGGLAGGKVSDKTEDPVRTGDPDRAEDTVITGDPDLAEDPVRTGDPDWTEDRRVDLLIASL
jgi:hypothetical protein